jgi:hypothetical protein
MASSPPKTIGFDVDNTLVDTGSLAIAYAKSEFGVEPSPELRTEGITKAFPTLTRDQVSQILSLAWIAPEKLAPIHPDTQSVFDEIRSCGFDIAIVTASFGNPENIKLWLNNNGITYDHFYHVKETRGKLEVPTHVLVDDSIRTGLMFAEAGKPYLWMEGDVTKETRSRLVSYPTVFPIKTLDDVPRLLSSNNLLIGLLRKDSTT